MLHWSKKPEVWSDRGRSSENDKEAEKKNAVRRRRSVAA